jgi:phospholipase/carboxylesterase
LVLFHGHGGNEEQALKLAPRISRRNFVILSLRGPANLGVRHDGRAAYGWESPEPQAESCEDYVRSAVEQLRRTYHIHSERIYLVGINEGAAAAYTTAFHLGSAIAGVASLNGVLPRPTPGTPLFHLPTVRGMRVFIGHGIANSVVTLGSAERDRRLFYTAGANVALQTYPTTHRLHADMLRDLNRWVIGHVNAQTDTLVLR